MKYRVNFYLDQELGKALKAIKEADGIPEAEQIRRGIKMWLESKGHKVKAQKGGKRKR